MASQLSLLFSTFPDLLAQLAQQPGTASLVCVACNTFSCVTRVRRKRGNKTRNICAAKQKQNLNDFFNSARNVAFSIPSWHTHAPTHKQTRKLSPLQRRAHIIRQGCIHNFGKKQFPPRLQSRALRR